VIITGRPGSGKTTLAKRLSELLHMPMLSRDELKEGFVSTFGVSHDELPADTNRKVTDLFFFATQMLLEAKVSLIVEAAFQHKLWKEIIVPWSSVSRLRLVICEADPIQCAQRHLNRGLDDPTREFYHGDKRVRIFKETGEFLGPGDYDAPSFDVPTLRVSTAEGYSPELTAIRGFVMEEKDS
jgi:predicted kinase